MKCSVCGRESEHEKSYVETWEEYGPNGAWDYGYLRCVHDRTYCSEHIPGHVKRQALGITEIPGAARLGARGK